MVRGFPPPPGRGALAPARASPSNVGARPSNARVRTAAAGRRALMDTYYHPSDLHKFGDVGKEAPELWEKFSAWYDAVFAEGALTGREKALIALAVAHAVQCPYCIDAYTTASLEKGADPGQMTEAAHVAAAIRGGASLVHGVQMRNRIGKTSM